MNRFNPEKLLLSKWTAVTPESRQKHFLVSGLIRDEDNRVTGCIIEAVMTRKQRTIDYQELRDTKNWLQGWK